MLVKAPSVSRSGLLEAEVLTLTQDFIIHSTNYDGSNLFHLGIDITEFGSELGAYGEHSSNGNKFWIVSLRYRHKADS